jgi:hypothetical protein
MLRPQLAQSINLKHNPILACVDAELQFGHL